jgi:hypothetical protein
MISVCRRSVEVGIQKIASVPPRGVQCGKQICRQSAGDLSRVAFKRTRQWTRELSRLASKYGVQVQAQCRGWLLIKICIVLGKCPGLQQKFSSMSRRKVVGGSLKKTSVCSRCAQSVSQKMESVCLRSIEVGTQKSRQGPREVSREAAKEWLQCPCEV